LSSLAPPHAFPRRAAAHRPKQEDAGPGHLGTRRHLDTSFTRRAPAPLAVHPPSASNARSLLDVRRPAKALAGPPQRFPAIAPKPPRRSKMCGCKCGPTQRFTGASGKGAARAESPALGGAQNRGFACEASVAAAPAPMRCDCAVSPLRRERHEPNTSHGAMRRVGEARLRGKRRVGYRSAPAADASGGRPLSPLAYLGARRPLLPTPALEWPRILRRRRGSPLAARPPRSAPPRLAARPPRSAPPRLADFLPLG
jgi:hypothetical protein